jgi:hypothetical protein
LLLGMAMLGMPLLILNLGGEMVYILDQVRQCRCSRMRGRAGLR